jgi:hypothetical protein
MCSVEAGEKSYKKDILCAVPILASSNQYPRCSHNAFNYSLCCDSEYHNRDISWVFLSPTRQILDEYLKLAHDQFVLYNFKLITLKSSYSSNLCIIVWAIDSVLDKTTNN